MGAGRGCFTRADAGTNRSYPREWEFGDVEKEIRTMCDQSRLSNDPADITVSEPAKLDAWEKAAGDDNKCLYISLRVMITVRRSPLHHPMSSGGDNGSPYPAPTRTGQMIMAAGLLTAVLLTSST